MSAISATRSTFRQSRLVLRRNNNRQASTASDAASKAKDVASQTTSKASEGLSKVSGSASSAASGAVEGARNTMNKVGGRAGRMISFVDSLIPPTVYYSKVGLELGRLIVKNQKMAPPSLQQFQSAFQPVTNVLKNPRSLMSSTASSAQSAANSAKSAANSAAKEASPETIISNIRNINREQAITYGVIGAEVLGFFTVGTMIGRLKLVGYHGEPHHAH